MANDTSLTYSLYGKDVSASKALQNIGKEAENTGGAFSKIKTIAAGVFAGNVLQNAGQDALNFAKESIGAYQEVGKEVINLQRYTGDSAEAMSKLRFAAEESGVGADTLATALKRMSQAAATTAGEKKFEALGISVKDANGHFKAASDIFTEVAGKIAAMPPGVEKTNAIIQIFGKSGMQLYPLLNQGAAGIAKFGAEAQKLGLVLNGDSLKGVQANVQAQRDFHAAVQGLQVQLGQYLYPAITAVTKAFSEIIPIFTTILRPAFEEIGKILLPIIGYIQNLAQYIIDLGTHFADTGNHMSIFKDIGKDVGNVVKDLQDIFKNLLPVLEDIWKFVATYLAPVIGVALVVAFKAVAITAGLIKDAIVGVIDLMKGLVDLAKDVGVGIKDAFNFIVSGIKGYIDGIITIINAVIDLVDKIHFKVPDWVPVFGGKEFGISIPKIPMLADGGIVNSPTLAMVGEAGPEAVVPLSKGGIGQGMNVTVNVSGSVITEKDLAVKMRNELAQLMRRKGAPLATLGL
jgi:hypothetical protein